MEQTEIKKELVDILVSYNSDLIAVDYFYLDDLASKITDKSDLGLIKYHIINFLDCCDNSELVRDLNSIIFEIDAIEPETKKEIKGDIIELKNNIKLGLLVDTLSQYINHGGNGVKLTFQNKDIIIWFRDESGYSSNFVVSDLDVEIYSNTVSLFNTLYNLVGSIPYRENRNENIE